MKFNKDDLYILTAISDSSSIKRTEVKQNLVNELYDNSITDKRANRIIVRSAGKLAQSGCIKIIPDFHADEDGYIDVRRNVYKITDRGNYIANLVQKNSYEEYYIDV